MSESATSVQRAPRRRPTREKSGVVSTTVVVVATTVPAPALAITQSDQFVGDRLYRQGVRVTVAYTLPSGTSVLQIQQPKVAVKQIGKQGSDAAAAAIRQAYMTRWPRCKEAYNAAGVIAYMLGITEMPPPTRW